MHETATCETGPNAGKVLLAGGFDTVPTAEVDLYDPATETFAPGKNPMSEPRAVSVVVALEDGRVLFTGGYGADLSPAGVATADLYDPATETFTSVAMTAPRSGHSAVRLPGGKVLIAGGQDARENPVASAERCSSRAARR